jgi:hypothetical protein
MSNPLELLEEAQVLLDNKSIPEAVQLLDRVGKRHY